MKIKYFPDTDTLLMEFSENCTGRMKAGMER